MDSPQSLNKHFQKLCRSSHIMWPHNKDGEDADEVDFQARNLLMAGLSNVAIVCVHDWTCGQNGDQDPYFQISITKAPEHPWLAINSPDDLLHPWPKRALLEGYLHLRVEHCSQVESADPIASKLKVHLNRITRALHIIDASTTNAAWFWIQDDIPETLVASWSIFMSTSDTATGSLIIFQKFESKASQGATPGIQIARRLLAVKQGNLPPLVAFIFDKSNNVFLQLDEASCAIYYRDALEFIQRQLVTKGTLARFGQVQPVNESDKVIHEEQNVEAPETPKRSVHVEITDETKKAKAKDRDAEAGKDGVSNLDQFHKQHIADTGSLMPTICDRPECVKVLKQVPQQYQCGYCKRVFYCSQSCLYSDWTAGLHQRTCAPLNPHRDVFGRKQNGKPDSESLTDARFVWPMELLAHSQLIGMLSVHALEIWRLSWDRGFFFVDFSHPALEQSSELAEFVEGSWISSKEMGRAPLTHAIVNQNLPEISNLVENYSPQVDFLLLGKHYRFVRMYRIPVQNEVRLKASKNGNSKNKHNRNRSMVEL